MNAKTSDISVYTGAELNRRFFEGTPESVSRLDDPSGHGEWVNISFMGGGQVSVFTEKPIVFIEPERH